MTTADPSSSHVPSLRQSEAFTALQGELQALGSEGLPRINLDIRQAVITVLGCIPELLALSPRLAAEAPTVDAQLFAKLERYTLAMGHAQTVFQAASQPMEPVAELTEELRILVDRFSTDAGALAKRGLVDASRLALLAGTNGAKNTAASAFLLVQLFRQDWARIVGKTAVAPTELDHAEELANRLQTAVGVRDQAPAGAPEAALARLKAHALFSRAYDETRRVVGFLRWREGDADDLAPSLYAGRGGRRSSSELPREEDAAANEPGVLPPAAGGASSAGPVAGSVLDTRPGMPGSSPFIDG